MEKALSMMMVFLLVLSGVVGFVNLGCQESEGEGLADSAWPCYGHDRKNTGRSPYDTSHLDGTVKWQFNFSKRTSVYASPAIGTDGTIYVTTTIKLFESTDNHNEKGKVFAINRDGKKKWEFTTEKKIESSPVIANGGTVYVGTRGGFSDSGALYAINPDGTEKWNVSPVGHIGSSPTIGMNGTIYFGSYFNNLYAVSPDGTEKWNFSTRGGIRSSPAIGSNGTIYVGSRDKALYAINSDGMEKWNFSTGGNVDSSPAIGSDGTIYVGSNDGNLYAVNPNGTEKWNFSLGHVSDYSSGPAIGRDGTIYVGSDDNKMYAINPDGTEKWNLSIPRPSTPSIGSDGTIYIECDIVHIFPSPEPEIKSIFYAIDPDGTKKWNFTMEYPAYNSPTIGSDGTVYVANSHTLYAFGEPEDDTSLTVYQMIILAVAVITVISIVIWKKKKSGNIENEEHTEEKAESENKYDEIEK